MEPDPELFARMPIVLVPTSATGVFAQISTLTIQSIPELPPPSRLLYYPLLTNPWFMHQVLTSWYSVPQHLSRRSSSIRARPASEGDAHGLINRYDAIERDQSQLQGGSCCTDETTLINRSALAEQFIPNHWISIVEPKPQPRLLVHSAAESPQAKAPKRKKLSAINVPRRLEAIKEDPCLSQVVSGFSKVSTEPNDEAYWLTGSSRELTTKRFTDVASGCQEDGCFYSHVPNIATANRRPGGEEVDSESTASKTFFNFRKSSLSLKRPLSTRKPRKKGSSASTKQRGDGRLHRAGSNQPIVDNMQDSLPNKRRKKSSRFVGVSFYTRTRRWESHIWIRDRQYFLGSYSFEEAAASAYDKAVLVARDQKTSRVNFDPSNYDVTSIQQWKSMPLMQFVRELQLQSHGDSHGAVEGLMKDMRITLEEKFAKMHKTKLG